MLYGERLQVAMDRRGQVTGQVITRAFIAKVADCSVQNVGVVIKNAKGRDQRFHAKAHAAAAAFLKVNPDWLLNGTGEMDLPPPNNAPAELTQAAIEMAALYDMIPVSEKIARAQAFNLATTAIMTVLQSLRATPTAKTHQGIPAS